MPPRDRYHGAARRALERDGWVITHDPLIIPFGSRELYADLGADAPLAAEREGRQIAVEIKGFLGPSPVVELERALGQFLLYEFLMEAAHPGRVLYLGVPNFAFDVHLKESPARDFLAAHGIRLVVFDAEAR